MFCFVFHSHNDIKDVGFNYIIEGIIEQRYGLSVLMVWNNHLTKIIAYEVLRLLVSNKHKIHLILFYLKINETEKSWEL